MKWRWCELQKYKFKQLQINPPPPQKKKIKNQISFSTGFEAIASALTLVAVFCHLNYKEQ